ncbi:uncharacterized protein DS421_19g670790 [Arachis hypogaea]|uniref:THUMP domain-containing protein n=1 Tax=Arachis hypogaea TaxID=3818 RepID=A0A6B9VDN0_ARAHY|nr:uncharacterized protein DS421_19g670790 [Arachis hypogaea]
MAEDGGVATITGRNEHEEREDERETPKEKKEMSPWEQHSAVIKLPRFDYNAPSSLLHGSHSGFLITCTIKREKSATKEAISILHKFARPFSKGSYNSLNNLEDDNASKKRRVCTEDDAEECLDNKEKETASATANSGDGKLLSGSGNRAKTDSEEFLDALPDTVDIVSNIIQAYESGSVKSPAWCHHIFPIQATCGLNEKELQEVVSMLVKKFVDDKQNILERPVKFAVGYNRRGIEEMKSVKEKSKDSNAFSLLDRNKCFGIVASAVNDVVGDSVVDLRTPELCVLVEVLPISGVPNGSIVVAVSVLPRNLVSTKPRLCVRALNSNTKEGSMAE